MYVDPIHAHKVMASIFITNEMTRRELCTDTILADQLGVQRDSS